MRFGACIALVGLAGLAAAQFPPINPPRIPGVNIPGIRDLMRGESPLTTTFNDATQGLEFLDGWNPDEFIEYRDLSSATKTDSGWSLEPGYYTGVIHSFCAHAGTRGPSQGLGYLYAPYRGARADLLKRIMARYPTANVDQQDAQLLVWAILARAKMSELQGGAREAASRLLEPADMAMLETGTLDFLDDRIMREIMGPVDSALRPIYQAENQLRGMLYQANRPFAELERIAVLPPVEDPSEFLVSSGRWLWHPDGYAIRYRPQGYARTTVEIVCPRPYELVRDAKNRITRLEMADGWISEVEYDDSVPPQSIPDDPNVRAFKFKKVTWIAPPDESGERIYSVEDEGWCFVENPNLTAFDEFFATIAPPSSDDWFDNWVGRFRYGRERWEQIQEARRQADRLGRIQRGEASEDDFLDLGHYRDGLGTVRGTPADRINWIMEHQQRQNEALINATNMIDSLGNGTDYDPSDTLIIPANRSSQRLMGAGSAH